MNEVGRDVGLLSHPVTVESDFFRQTRIVHSIKRQTSS
jgi:hypothetical protein